MLSASKVFQPMRRLDFTLSTNKRPWFWPKKSAALILTKQVQCVQLALPDNANYAICVTPSVIPGDAQLALSNNAKCGFCVTCHVIPGDAQLALSDNAKYWILNKGDCYWINMTVIGWRWLFLNEDNFNCIKTTDIEYRQLLGIKNICYWWRRLILNKDKCHGIKTTDIE